MINGGLGIAFAGDDENWKVISYAVVAGIIWMAYAIGAVILTRRQAMKLTSY